MSNQSGTSSSTPSAPASSAAAKPRFIHLLYVPTNMCSLRCSYCYLDHDALLQSQTDPANPAGPDPLKTLDFAVKKIIGAEDTFRN